MSEMALTATNLVVIGRGTLIADTTVDDFIASNTEATVLVRSPEPRRLADTLTGLGNGVTASTDGSLLVTGATPAEIGEAAHHAGVVLHELRPQQASLEDVFMELTADAVDYHGTDGMAVTS